MARLLLVEDDETIGDLLRTALVGHGYEVDWTTTGQDAVSSATVERYELVLLDLGLPDVDGIEICRQLRVLQPGSVLVMLTARNAEMDVIVGLEAGADDYLTKPFRFPELLARIKAHLRRGGVGAEGEDNGPWRVGRLFVDGRARVAMMGECVIPLRAKEFDLLVRLVQEPGVAITRETLMSEVWDENWFGPTKTLDVHIAAVRRKLLAAAAEAKVPEPRITTLRGRGYRLEAAV